MAKGTDKRSVITDALETLGTIIDASQKRDAIHLAVVPSIAATHLRPGDDVGFLPDGTAGAVENPIGIVDPFLKDTVLPQQRFWLVIYPRQITSLRHVWTHPALPDEEAMGVVNSKLWLESYAKTLDVTYSELVRHAKDYIEHREYWIEGGRFEGEYVADEFWPHFEAVTGIIVKEEQRGSFFSCSC